MNVNEISFGIEIETTIPYGVMEVGSYSRGIQIPNAPDGWVLKFDCTIQARGARRGAEVVSPVLKGVDGLRQIRLVCDLMKTRGAKVNRSTGLHIHVGFDRREDKALARLVTLVSNFERAIYASTGTHSRETGDWCRGIQRWESSDRAINYGAGHDRYHVLNLTNLLGRGHGHRTVEFRAFGGSLNPDKIIAYVRMVVGLVERAHKAKRVTNWAAKNVATTSPIHRNGDGQTALTRLFYQLGWIKGRQSHTHGDLSEHDLPGLSNSKRTLMRLARKYDLTTC